jgi:2',3'-cyclic-nucleotide 2'-phosphodiesterase (5'-nucleotidase family)
MGNAIQAVKFLCVCGLFLTATFGFAQVEQSLDIGADITAPVPPQVVLSNAERLVTILATNDIHGAIESEATKDGLQGGIAYWAGITDAIRAGLKARFQERAGVALVDGGDQYQGTLISNYGEGQAVFAAMGEMGYDMAIPGNHGFDFGPIGWLDDKVAQNVVDKNPRGALERLVAQSKFPLVSANTYLLSSLVDESGASVVADNSGCVVKAGGKIDWSSARRPDYARPYLIKNLAGVRVAFIGVDASNTPTTTALENVSDLCFRDEAETYNQIRREIGGQADLFILVVHQGNINNELYASAIVDKIQKTYGTASANVINGAVAAHTHTVHNVLVNGVPVIQSGSSLQAFGRLDFVWDSVAKTLVTSKTRSFAGLTLIHGKCTAASGSFCKVEQNGTEKTIKFEGIAVTENTRVKAIVESARALIEPLGDRKIGIADGAIGRDRIRESALSDAITDQMRAISGTEIAMINTGGLRDGLPAGDITYEQLFVVLPFNNHAVVVSPLSADNVIALLERSIQTCGAYGALMQSGLKVRFERNCKNSVADEHAKLLHVETVGGEVILDAQAGINPRPDRSFSIATLDYVATGSSGWSQFAGATVVRDIGILREAIAQAGLSLPVHFNAAIDRRWTESSANAVPAGNPESVLGLPEVRK